MIEKEKVKEIVSEKSEREKIKEGIRSKKKTETGAVRKATIECPECKSHTLCTTMNAQNWSAMNAVLLSMMNHRPGTWMEGFWPWPENETLPCGRPDDLYHTRQRFVNDDRLEEQGLVRKIHII